MAINIGTDYQQVVSAVGDYYGTGSDQWLEIARHGIYAQNAESILSQVPGVSITKNRAGEITAYSYSNPFTLNSGGIAGDINSNAQLPTQGNGNTFTSQIPSSGGINQQTGNIDFSSGAKQVSDNATVPTTFATVSTAVAGLSIGTRFGKNVLQTIYNSDPEYWDNTFPTINPQTWDTLAGNNKLGKSVINALFRIDKSTNQAQMYLPEDALAYYAYAMKEEGFFSTGGGGQITSGDSWAQSQSWYSLYDMPIPFGSTLSWEIQSYANRYRNVIAGDLKIIQYIANQFLLASTTISQFTRLQTLLNTGNTETINIPTFTGNMNGKTFYYATYSLSSSAAILVSPDLYTNSHNRTIANEIAYLALYGVSQESGGKEGVEPQEGAPTYNTSGWTDPAATAADLKANHPDLYTNAIYTDVAQPDGSTKRIIYVPVPTTGTSGSNDETPTNTEVAYDQTVVDTNSPDDLLKTIIRYITETQSENKDDTPTPPDVPNPTDTGEGNTPPVVVPTGNASALWSVYNPTQAQLNSFGAWLWSSNFIDQVLKLFNNPMQSIIGVHKIFAAPAISGTGNIVVGYLDSGVSTNLVSAQYTTVNCGSVSIREQFGNVFDYTDTQVRLYLPFIGIVDLDTSDVMRGTISVVYHVDVITGACLAEVRVTRDSAGGTLYQFAGDAAVRYPISSGSYMGVVAGIASAVGGVVSAIATGGATLPLAAGAVAGGLSGAKTNVQHSGSFGGNAGAMGAKKPYLIIERPQTLIAENYEKYQGNGANIRRTVGQMSGYFKFSDVHTDSINGAAESEIEAIRAALESGVIA